MEKVAGGDEEYETEGVCVSIKWFMGILDDHKPGKKDADTIKKLKQILDEIEKAIKEQHAIAQQ